MQLNLSDLTEIKVEAIGEQIHLTISNVLSGTIPQSLLKQLIAKNLGIPDASIQILERKGDLIFAFADLVNLANQPNQTHLGEEIAAIISQYLPATLENRVTGRKVFYITEESGVPLLGSIYFGIIDRGTNLLQVRPLTGCLLNCPFCSVDEGRYSKTRVTDYIVADAYLVKEIRKLIDFKGVSDIEIHIDGQSEPTLYPHLTRLIAQLKADPRIKVISMQTNGVPLTKIFVRELEKAGLTRINLSINSLNPKTARILAGTPAYDIAHIEQITREIANSAIELLISPLWVPGVNDNDIQEIISFTENLNVKGRFPILGIQNYLKYKFGRRMPHVKMVNRKRFEEQLQAWGKSFTKHNLLLERRDFGIHNVKSCPKPFHKGERVQVEILLPGRLASKHTKRREMLACAKDRIIHVMNSTAEVGSSITVRLTSTKDNIFYARQL
ncbi:MAG: radical SAM protein [Promethearchaeota archaeon]|nr:MAG: radical SAM protein [Candidatus Lokiarchaeota archaeon]